MKNKFIFLLFLIGSVFGNISAQSDDITLIGESSPLFFLENSFSGTVLTSENENLTVSVHDISVEKNRVLIRFYAAGVPETWNSKITDNNRLYGSYLPVAEIVLDNGKILTPSSLSKFSYLEYNGERIIGGLLVFSTNDIPQAFYLNFNQLPFDTKPLSEGFSKAVILTSAVKDTSGTAFPKTWSVSGDGLEFTLDATAQTSEFTMLQPIVHLERADEILSKFGWITISDPSDGRRFGVTRGNLYGFNLTDDSTYSPAHAYVFAALGTEKPVQISMDHAYIVRSFDPVGKDAVDLTGKRNTVIHLDDDFEIKITEVHSLPDEDRIRFYIDSGEKAIADISFKFYGLSDINNPAVTCGMDPVRSSFACDIVFDDISFPLNTLTLGIDAIEYRKDGPWTIFWTPVPMGALEKSSDITVSDFPFTYAYPYEKSQPEEIRQVLDAIEKRNAELTASPGWIHESYELNYELIDNTNQTLIPVDQYEMYFTYYQTENWYHIDKNGCIYEILSFVRESDANTIHNAQLQRSEYVTDLIHGLFSQTNQPLEKDYSCFKDFSDIAESSAVFLSEEKCSENKKCINFHQSLNGLPSGPGSQSITFEVDSKTDFIYREIIDYDYGKLILTKDTLTLEKTDSLPDEIHSLMDSVK